MLRTARSRGALALVAAGALVVSACAAGGAGGPQAAPAPVATSAASAQRTSTPTTTAPGTRTVPPSPTAPTSDSGSPVPTLTYRATASTWAEALVGGTVTTTAARPSITPTALADQATVPVRPTARTLTAPRSKRGKTVYLTFDDGPSPRYTRKVLALLAKYDAKATFFVIGRQVRGDGAALVRAEYVAGHGVGNHTWDHHSLRRTRPKTFTREVGRTQRAVRRATGHAPVCLRPPMGATDRHTRARAKKAGMRLAMWNVDPGDWRNAKPRTIARRVVGATRDGSIVLMHDGGGNRTRSVAALAIILAKLDERGYTFAAMCR